MLRLLIFQNTSRKKLMYWPWKKKVYVKTTNKALLGCASHVDEWYKPYSSIKYFIKDYEPVVFSPTSIYSSACTEIKLISRILTAFPAIGQGNSSIAYTNCLSHQTRVCIGFEIWATLWIIFSGASRFAFWSYVKHKNKYLFFHFLSIYDDTRYLQYRLADK